VCEVVVALVLSATYYIQKGFW